MNENTKLIKKVFVSCCLFLFLSSSLCAVSPLIQCSFWWWHNRNIIIKLTFTGIQEAYSIRLFEIHMGQPGLT